MEAKIKDIYCGKPDAKDEIVNPNNKFFESFILPPNFDVDELVKDDKFFIKGYKGSGKTALLLYINHKLHEQNNNTISTFMYFKEYSNLEKASMNNVSQKFYNQSEESVIFDKRTMLKEQSFIYIWRWLFFDRIIEDNENNGFKIFNKDEQWNSFAKIVKRISYDKIGDKNNKFPKRLKIAGSYCNFMLSSEMDFSNKQNSAAYVAFIETIDEATQYFLNLSKTKTPYYIFIDELEAYYSDIKIFKRDLTMLRDLLFVVKEINNVFIGWGYDVIKIFCSIRTEVLNSINKFIPPKELNKITDGYEKVLSWNYNIASSRKHPIFQVWLKRIALAEEKTSGIEYDDEELYKKWFPETIHGIEPIEFYLSLTWYKPRDIVRFISACQNSLANNEGKFTPYVYQQAISEYSNKSLTEVIEELNAIYTPTQTEEILTLFRGYDAEFSRRKLEFRAKQVHSSEYIVKNLNDILNNLYRVGFLGNVQKLTNTFSWQHRGNNGLLLSDDWEMTVHRGLRKALLISSKQDKLKELRDSFVYEGEEYEAEIKAISNNFLIFEFEKNQVIRQAYTFTNQPNNYKINQKFLIKIVSYNKEHRRYNSKILNKIDSGEKEKRSTVSLKNKDLNAESDENNEFSNAFKRALEEHGLSYQDYLDKFNS